jgi:hypothetical protein
MEPFGGKYWASGTRKWLDLVIACLLEIECAAGYGEAIVSKSIL